MDAPAASGDDDTIIAILRDPESLSTDKELAFQRLHARYSSDLRAFLRSKVGPDAMMDVEQTVWLRIWQKIATHFDGKHFRAWLYQIARHEVINHHRKKKKTVAAQLPESLEDHRVSLPDDDEERRKALETCLGKLELRSHEVICDRLGGLLTNDQIATKYKLTKARLFSLVSEIRRELTECVKEKMS